MSKYPYEPAKGKTDTSAAAALKMAPLRQGLEREVYNALAVRPMANFEIAQFCHRNPLSTKPRASEMRARRLIQDSGHRRKNPWGNSEIVWQLTP